MPDCTCKRDEPPKGDGIVRVGRETKGRKGAGVTIITGVPLRPSELAGLASTLKKKCATGGTVREGVIEIQGDHGLLFKLAVTVLFAAVTVLIIRRRDLPLVGERF